MVGVDIVRKISTTIQLPKELIEALSDYKAKTGISKNLIIEKSVQAFFEGRILDLPDDLMKELDRIEEQFGSPYNFVIERALRLFLAKDVEMQLKKK